ncbi:unnamed protein product, partial [Allacma fusca]
VDNIFFHK